MSKNHIQTHPTRPMITMPDSALERKIDIVDKSASAAIIDLSQGSMPDPYFGHNDEADRIRDLGKGAN